MTIQLYRWTPTLYLAKIDVEKEDNAEGSWARSQMALSFDGKGHRIYVRQNSYNDFEQLVKPYIQTCMAYKLP